ncbi:uncharacterized protein IWZ02DRAFT_63367 [Phyllosticta citriasiana]|uniref:uncharacterized protein n=1 Tax=Phyllosticta citriasiana TaxID=595635 RepID=UPI0030FDBF95
MWEYRRAGREDSWTAWLSRVKRFQHNSEHYSQCTTHIPWDPSCCLSLVFVFRVLPLSGRRIKIKRGPIAVGLSLISDFETIINYSCFFRRGSDGATWGFSTLNTRQPIGRHGTGSHIHHLMDIISHPSRSDTSDTFQHHRGPDESQALETNYKEERGVEKKEKLCREASRMTSAPSTDLKAAAQGLSPPPFVEGLEWSALQQAILRAGSYC